MNNINEPQQVGLSLGPFIWSPSLQIHVPSTLTPPTGEVFTWSEEDGAFLSATRSKEEYLYVEPDDHRGTISQDSYYELPGD